MRKLASLIGPGDAQTISVGIGIGELALSQLSLSHGCIGRLSPLLEGMQPKLLLIQNILSSHPLIQVKHPRTDSRNSAR